MKSQPTTSSARLEPATPKNLQMAYRDNRVWESMAWEKSNRGRADTERFPDAEKRELGGKPHGAWSYPEAEITCCGDFFDLRLHIPGLESQSVIVEAAETLLILSGLRWNTSPKNGEKRLSPFRRLVDLPAPVRGDSWQVSCHGGLLSVRVAATGEARA
jgi:HSP20 family molecular chaperone IbpA